MFPQIFQEYLQENEIDPALYSQDSSEFRFVALLPGTFLSLEDLEEDLSCKVEQCSEFPLFYKLVPPYPNDVISKSALYRSGKIMAMDLSSGLAVRHLDIVEGDQILDLCCAPGNKMTLAALMTKASGSVTGVDISGPRLAIARSIVKKYRAPNVRLFLDDGCTFDWRPFVTDRSGPDSDKKCFYSSSVYRKSKGSYDPNRLYDKVLVDAQCTHDGSIKHVLKCQEKGWTSKDTDQYSETNLRKLHELQLSLITNGFRLVKPGGTLIYSTCSFSKRQNEDIVEQLMAGHADAMPLPLYPEEPSAFIKRFSPLTSGTGGFFIAKIGKRASQQ